MNLIDQSLRQIGIAIRDRRAARRMTLGDLAGETGMSLSFLSRVERGQAQTSVGNLIRIAEALGGTLHDLIGPAPAEDTGFSIYRGAEAATTAISAGGYRWVPVSGGGAGRNIEATLLDLPADPVTDTRFSHPGEELCFVLEGRVRFLVGEASALLAPGDAIHLRSDIPHTAAAEVGPARVMMITHHPSGLPSGFRDRPDWWNPGGTVLPATETAMNKRKENR